MTVNKTSKTIIWSMTENQFKTIAFQLCKYLSREHRLFIDHNNMSDMVTRAIKEVGEVKGMRNKPLTKYKKTNYLGINEYGRLAKYKPNGEYSHSIDQGNINGIPFKYLKTAPKNGLWLSIKENGSLNRAVNKRRLTDEEINVILGDSPHRKFGTYTDSGNWVDFKDCSLRISLTYKQEIEEKKRWSDSSIIPNDYDY